MPLTLRELKGILESNTLNQIPYFTETKGSGKKRERERIATCLESCGHPVATLKATFDNNIQQQEMAAIARLLGKLGRNKLTFPVLLTTTCSTVSTRKGVSDVTPAPHQLLIFIQPSNNIW